MTDPRYIDLRTSRRQTGSWALLDDAAPLERSRDSGGNPRVGLGEVPGALVD